MSNQRALFSQYENDYRNKSKDISRKIEAISSLSGDSRRRETIEIECDIKEADRVIKRMDMEARSLPSHESHTMLQKILEYKTDLQTLKDALKKAAQCISNEDTTRAELGLHSGHLSSTNGQQDRMLTATEKLNHTGARLQQAHQQLLESEAVGASILEDLQRQRETIQHTSAAVGKMDEQVKQGQQIANRMGKRAKWIFWP